jgi:hypothetical protein
VSSDGSYVYIDPDKLTKFVRDTGGPVLNNLAGRASNVQGGARRQVGKRTRRLERSIVKRVGADARGPFILVVTEGVTYGFWHHEGNTRGWPGNKFLTDNLHLAGRNTSIRGPSGR